MPFADMVRNRPERGTRCGCQVHEKSLDKDGPSCIELNVSSRLFVISLGKFGDACILLKTQEGTLRFYACNVLGHSLYTVYTRSSRHSCTHHSGGAATHSNSLTRLTPRRTCRMPPQPRTGRTAAAPPCRRSASPRPRAARLHRDEHGREQLVHERIRLRDHVHTSAHARGSRVVPARHDRSGVGPICAATQEFASGVHSFNNSRHRGIMMLTL